VSVLALNRRTAVAALATAAVLAGGAAYAYPSGTKMTVTATSTSADAVTVTVSNANPACQIRVRIDNDAEITLPVSGTSATGTVSVPAPGLSPGRHRVSARTVNCTAGTKKEHAHNRFVLANANVSGNPSSAVGKNYTVNVSGLPEDTPVSFVGTGPGGQQVTDHDTADKRGEAKGKVKLKVTGIWSIVVTAQPPGQPAAEIGTVTVTVS
jgi:hypothetical protein